MPDLKSQVRPDTASAAIWPARRFESASTFYKYARFFSSGFFSIGYYSAQPDKRQNGKDDNDHANDPKDVIHCITSYEFVSQRPIPAA